MSYCDEHCCGVMVGKNVRFEGRRWVIGSNGWTYLGFVRGMLGLASVKEDGNKEGTKSSIFQIR